MSRIVEINDISQLAGYELLWSSLLARTVEASFFQSLDWLRAYWNHVGRDQRFRILVAFSGGEVIGIVPLVILYERTKLGGVRVLTYPSCPGGNISGPIGPNPAATLALAMQHIQRTPRHWHVLDLRTLDTPGRGRSRTRNAIRMSGLSVHESIWGRAAAIETDGSWEGYLTNLAPLFRETVQDQQQALNRSGSVKYVRYRPRGSRYGDDDPRWDLYAACMSLSHKMSRETPFHSGDRETYLSAIKRGALDLNLLFHNGRPVAFRYGFHYLGQVHIVREGGVFPHTDIDVNLVLRAQQIQDSCGRGDHRILLGPSNLPQDQALSTCVVPTYRYTHVPVRLASQLSRLKRWIG